MKKLYRIIYLIILLNLFFAIFNVNVVKAADDLSIIKTDMKGVSEGQSTGKIPEIIKKVIDMLQYAGTGISVIVVTMLGIKYMIASSGEKAEIKKQAEPIIIGCVLLFAAVNIVKIIANIGINVTS